MANTIKSLKLDKDKAEIRVQSETLEFLKWPTNDRLGILTKACKDFQTAESNLHQKEYSEGWIEVGTADWGDHFYEIRVDVSQRLDENEIALLSGCLGYALREQVRGEDLSIPNAEEVIAGVQVPSSMTHHGAPPLGAVVGLRLYYSYDTSKTRSDDPLFNEAFRKATEYIQNGTPRRKTNRSGPNRMGTSLVKGIGRVPLRIFTR